MASLNGTFDASAVEPREAMDIVPPGDYRVVIVNSEMRPTKNGSGQFLWLEMSILDGEYMNRRVFDRLNLVNPNQQASEIAQRTLSAICHAVGRMQVSDSEQLHNLPMIAKVAVKPATEQYAAQNEVKGYAAVSSSTAPIATKSGPSTAALAPATAARPPWRRTA